MACAADRRTNQPAGPHRKNRFNPAGFLTIRVKPAKMTVSERRSFDRSLRSWPFGVRRCGPEGHCLCRSFGAQRFVESASEAAEERSDWQVTSADSPTIMRSTSFILGVYQP